MDEVEGDALEALTAAGFARDAALAALAACDGDVESALESLLLSGAVQGAPGSGDEEDEEEEDEEEEVIPEAMEERARQLFERRGFLPAALAALDAVCKGKTVDEMEQLGIDRASAQILREGVEAAAAPGESTGRRGGGEDAGGEGQEEEEQEQEEEEEEQEQEQEEQEEEDEEPEPQAAELQGEAAEAERRQAEEAQALAEAAAAAEAAAVAEEAAREESLAARRAMEQSAPRRSVTAAESAAKAKYLAMTIEQLRKDCDEKWLSSAGSKSELVARLVDYEKPEGGWTSPSSSPARVKATKKKAVKKKAPKRAEPSRAEDSASEGDPPESLAAVVKMAELTMEPLSIALDKDGSSATDTDGDGRVPLHHLCERRWPAELIRVVAEKAPATVAMVDSKGRTPLACLLAGQPSAKNFGDDALTTDSRWGQHLRKTARRGSLLRATRDHDGRPRVAAGDTFKYTGESRSEQCQVEVPDKGKHWLPWSVVELATERVTRPVTVEMVACLCEMDESIIAVHDKSNSLPIQIAVDRGLSAEVVDYLRTLTANSGAVWFSSAGEGDAAAESPSGSFHILVHAVGSGATPAPAEIPAHLQVPGALDCLATDPAFAASTMVRGLPFAAGEIAAVCCGPKHVGMLLKSGLVYRMGVKVRQTTLDKLAGNSAEDGGGKSATQMRLEQAEKQIAAQMSKVTEMKDRLRQLETQKYDVPDDDPLIEMLMGASEKSADDVKAALGRFPPGPQRGELAFNVLFGTQVFGTGDEREMPPDADAAGVQRFQLRKEEKRLAELEAVVQPLKDAIEEVAGAESDQADVMLSLSSLEAWPDPVCEFCQVASTVSELVAVGQDGKVYRWKWASETGEAHPKAPREATVSSIAASPARVSVLTDDGRLCSWLDSSMWTCRGMDGSALEQPLGDLFAEDEDDGAEESIPVLLHEVKGRNIEIVDDGSRAKKANGYNNAVVFTAVPVVPSSRGERRFELVIEKHGNSYAGSLRLGFTATDPSSFRSRRVETESYSISRSWILDGSTVHSASAGGQDSYPTIASMKADSRIAAVVDADGALRFEYDGVDQGIAAVGLPVDEDLWGVADLYGQCDQVVVQSGSGSKRAPEEEVLDKLEHDATVFDGLDSRAQSLAVSNRGSCAVTACGSVYWWGQKPFGLRLQSFRERQAANTADDFDKAFEEYIKTVDDKQLLCSKAEVTAMLANDHSYRERLRRAGSASERKKEKTQLKAGKRVTAKVGAESPQGKALQHLKEVYTSVTEKVRAGDTVIVSAGRSLYAKHSTVVVEDNNGFPKAWRSRRPVDKLDCELELIGYTDPRETLKTPLRNAIFTGREQRGSTAEVVQVNKAKGVAVLRSLDDDELVISDLVTLVPKQPVHDDAEAVQETPLRIFGVEELAAAIGENVEKVDLLWTGDGDAKQCSQAMVDYYGNQLEPTLTRFYRKSARVFSVTAVHVNSWHVCILMQEGQSLYQYTVDLDSGKWEYVARRHVAPAGVSAGRWMGGTDAKPLIELDEHNCVCSGSPLALPPVCYGAVGGYSCDGSSVSVVVNPPAGSESTGQRVTVSANYRDHDDAEQGPLKPGEFGTIDRSDGSRLRVKSDRGAKTWWYFPAALQLTKAVPPVLSLVPIGLGPTPAADDDAGGPCSAHAFLHAAAAGASTLEATMASASDESLRSLLCSRDATGATAFMCAMRRGDIVQADLVLRKAVAVQTASHPVLEAMIREDINRVSPLHALLGLGASTVERVEFTQAHVPTLKQILQEEGLACQRDSADRTALQSYVITHGLDTTSRWVCVNGGGVNVRREASFDRDPIGRLSPGDELSALQIKTVRGLRWVQMADPSAHGVPSQFKEAWVLIKKGPQLLEPAKTARTAVPEDLVNTVCLCSRAVQAALQVPPGAASADMADEWMDCFAYGLISCGQRLAASFARTVSKLCASPGTEAAAKAFVDSVCRVFTALLSTADDRKDAELRKVFSAVLTQLGGHAIQSLASIASRAVQSVRLGLPVPEVDGATYTLPVVGIAASDKGDVEMLQPPPEKSDEDEKPEDKQDKGTKRSRKAQREIGGPPTSIGQLVTVVDDYDDPEEFDDACDGPLEPGEEGTVESITGSRYLVRPCEDTSTTWWYDQTVLEVTGASSAKQTKPDTQQPKEQAIIGRAKMFHLCLVMITQLSRSPTLARTTTRRFSANPNEHMETSDVDQALLVATSLLQPAWTHVFECCEALEAILELQAKNGCRPSGSSKLKVSEQLRGQCDELETDRFRYLAFMLDALVLFKQALPVLEASDTEVDAPELRGLVRSISHLQLHPPAALRDAWSTLRRDELLESLQRMSDEEKITHTEGRDLRRSPLLWFLFRHRKTVEMLASIEDGNPIGQESFLNVLEPFEKKESRFNQRMSVRRTSIPEDRPALKLEVPRGEDLLEALFEQLTEARAEPVDGGGAGPREETGDGGSDDAADGGEQLALCRKLECSYVGEPGEGSGMTRMVVTDVTKALRSAEGAGVGLFGRSPLITAAAERWWETEPMGRVVPAEATGDGGDDEDAGPGDDVREERLRSVGNVIGLCLLHGVKFPLFFCRHVYKTMLDRKVNYADYAYFDPHNHAMLLSMVRDSAGMDEDEDMMLAWDETVGMSANPGVDAAPVTPRNVHAYVLKKAHYDMVDRVSEELAALRLGIFDVITPQDLADLTAEDLQLLLSGRGGAVSVSELKEALSFVDAREEAIRISAPDRLVRFSASFLEALELMSDEERLRIVEFATGSMARPEKLVVRLTDVSPPEERGKVDEVSAHACINDMSVPDFRQTPGSDDVIAAQALKELLLSTVELSRIVGTTFK